MYLILLDLAVFVFFTGSVLFITFWRDFTNQPTLFAPSTAPSISHRSRSPIARTFSSLFPSSKTSNQPPTSFSSTSFDNASSPSPSSSSSPSSSPSSPSSSFHLTKTELVEPTDFEIPCTNILEKADPCSFVMTTKSCQGEGHFNYVEFRYCTMRNVNDYVGNVLIVIILAFLLCWFLALLGQTADVWFVPSLSVIADELRLSPAVAGITLLAFGNSSPDILTGMSSFAKGDISLIMGSAAGTSLCIGACVLGSCLLVSKGRNTQIGKETFIRSMVGYVLCFAVYIGLAAKGTFRYYDAIVLLVCYFIYAFANVFYLQRQESRLRKQREQKRSHSFIRNTKSFRKLVELTSSKKKHSSQDSEAGRSLTANSANSTEYQPYLQTLDEDEPVSASQDPSQLPAPSQSKSPTDYAPPLSSVHHTNDDEDFPYDGLSPDQYDDNQDQHAVGSLPRSVSISLEPVQPYADESELRRQTVAPLQGTFFLDPSALDGDYMAAGNDTDAEHGQPLPSGASFSQLASLNVSENYFPQIEPPKRDRIELPVLPFSADTQYNARFRFVSGRNLVRNLRDRRINKHQAKMRLLIQEENDKYALPSTDGADGSDVGENPDEPEEYDDDEEEYDLTYYMDGIHFDPTWHEIKNKYKLWIFQFIWVISLPLSILRWLSIPATDCRPDYLLGMKRIAYHISPLFMWFMMGIFINGFYFDEDTKSTWIILAALGGGFAIGLNAIYFIIVMPLVRKYNLERQEMDEYVNSKADEPDLSPQELHELGQIVLKYNLDGELENSYPISMRIFRTAMSFIGAVSGLTWLALLASEVVRSLESCGAMFNLSPIFLGSTVLAIGGSSTDWIANLNLSSHGKMPMAYAGIFGSPIVILTFGTGLAIAAALITNKDYHHGVNFEVPRQLIACWATMAATVLITCVGIPASKFDPGRYKFFGILVCGLYVAFLIISVVLEILHHYDI